MIVKNYGLYDQTAKEFISLFTSKNDDTATRSAQYIVRDRNFDNIAGKDYVIQHLFDYDTATGIVCDNQVYFVVGLAKFIEDFQVEMEKLKASNPAPVMEEVKPLEKKDGEVNA